MLDINPGDEELLRWLAEQQMQAQPQRQQLSQPQYGVLQEQGYQDLRGRPVDTRGATSQQLAEMADNPVDPRSSLFRFPVGGAAEQQARQAAAGVQRVPGATGGQNLNQLRAIAESLKGMDPKFASAVMSKLSGIDPEAQRDAAMLRRQMALAQFQHGLGAGERKETRDARKEATDARIEAEKAQREALRLQRADVNRRAGVDDQRNDNAQYLKILTDKKLSPTEKRDAIIAFGGKATVTPGGWFSKDSVAMDSGQPAPVAGPNAATQAPAPTGTWQDVATQLASQAGKDPSKMSKAEKENFKAAALVMMNNPSGAAQAQPQQPAPAPAPRPNVFEPVKPPPKPQAGPAANAEEMNQKRTEQLKRAKIEDAFKKRQHAQQADQQKEQQKKFDERQKQLEEEARIKHEQEMLRIRQFRLKH